MRRTGSIARRELRSAFHSPMAYILIVAFLVLSSSLFFFLFGFFARDTASLRGYFGLFPLIFIVVIPALTMRSWAEERKMGTEELLLTLPYRESELVLGKFLGALGVLAVLLALTLPMPLTMSALGNFEAGEIVGEYLGALLLGSVGISFGLFVSSMSRNQISAFLIAFFGLLALNFLGYLATMVNLPRAVGSFLQYLSLSYHFDSFKKGILDTRDLVYFLAMTAFWLYLNTKILILRKWS